MKKNHSLFSLAALIGMMLCLFSANVSAASIDVEQARQVVEKFRMKATRGGMRRAPMAKGRLNHCYTKRTQAGTPAVYAFTNEGGGFALVAADDAVASVLGYSDTGTFDPDNIPDGLQYLLDEYAKEIASAGPRKANEQLPEPPYEVEETEQLGPLLETKWGQMRPYNLQSPLSIVGNAATGCMTTAIAQIMRYHKWPEQGYGSCEFDVNEGYNTIFTVRDYYTRHYNWDVMYPHTSQYTMRDEKNYDTNAVDVASVSQLMFDIGVGLSTDYTISGVSSAVEVRIIPLLTSYFNYDPGLEFVTLSKTTPEAFNHMLIEELQASRPVYLQGGPLGYGHAFVCDGYNGQGHFHITWGWEGKSDGYYLITGLTPAQQGTGGGSSSGYSENLKMLRHIMPYDGVAPRPQFKINRYSVEADANGNYLAAQFGVTKDRNIRGQLGVLVIDTEGNGKLFWDKDGGYTQINTAGTEGAYYDFHVNVDPSWTAPGTRVYYIYKECGDPQWRYVKDGGNNYCCIKFGLSGGNIVAEHNTSEPNYTGTPGNYYLNDDYEYALGNKITSLSQIQSGHVYAIARHDGPGFASINPSGGVLQGRTTFDTQGTTAFVFTGNTTAGYTIKSAVANAYLPVLTTTDSNGNVVSLGWGQEKFAIEDFNGDITDGLQIKSLGSSYGSGKVYLHCTGTTNNFLGWHGYSGGDSQMDIYEVTVNGQHTMPGTSEKLVVTYNIFLGNKKIGTRVYEETVGQAPTKDFVPYFVTAEDFPQTITGDVTAYDIHTSYNDKLPVDPSQYFNIGFTQGTTTYWWYNTGDGNGYCKESTTTPSATDKTAQWTLVGDWLNGFVVKNANQGKIVWARDVVNNSPIFLAVDQALDDKTFLLEHRDAGFYLHLKGRTMYLTHQSSNNVSINNTLNNAANLLTFAVPGEDPTTPDTPVDPVDPDTPDEPTGPYSLGDRVANIADIVSGELYAIVRTAGGYATLNTGDNKVVTQNTFATDGTAAFVFTGNNSSGYTIKSAVTDGYFPALALKSGGGSGEPIVLGSTQEKFTVVDNDVSTAGWQIKSMTPGNLFVNSGGADFVGWNNQSGANTQMYLYKVNYNGGETPVDPTPELHTYTVNVVGAPTGQTVTVTVKGQTVTGTSVTLDSTVSVTDVSATDISGYTYSVEVNGTTITVTYEQDDTPVGVTYTVNVVGAPTGQTVTVTVKGQTVTGTSVTLDSTVSTTDVSATDISGYAYSVEVNGSTITVTYTPVPYVVGKKYVIKSVAHANGKTYYILPPASGTKCEITETAPTSEDDVWTVESITPQTDGTYNVSFKNGSEYFAFLATTTTANHAVRLSRTDVDATSYWNIQDNLNYWPDKSTDTRFLFLAVKDDYATSSTIGWGSPQNGQIRSEGYSYQFQIDEFIGKVPVTYTFTVDGETIGTKVINETAGAAPTVASIIPSYVHASGIPATVEQNAYTIATTYTDLPFEVGKKYYINISNRVYWLYANSSYSCVKEATSKGTSSEYVWTTGGDWLNGFSFVNGLGYYIGAPSATPANSATTTVPTADGTLTRFDLVRNSDLGYRFKPHGGSNYLGHTSYTALNLSFFDYYARDHTYNYSNTLMFEEAVDEAGELQEKINTLLGMGSKIGTVGYPAWDHTAVTTLIENYMDDGVTEANYSAALMAYQTAIGTSDVVLPQPGHAYKLSLRSLDGTKHWYLTNNGVSTNEADAAIFVMGSSGRTDDYKAFFVTNDNTASHLLQYKGATGASYASGTCDFKIEPMVTKTGTAITASVLQRFGTFALTSETRPDGYTGTPGTLIFKETENKWDAANGAFMNGTYTTAIEMTEVPYPYTKPKLVAGDNGSFASIWLPFPMTFPEGVEVYKGTQERGADGETFLGLERVDTNRAVAAGGYILYSETLTGEIDVQPVAGTPADKHNTTDAAFYGCTEIYGTETGEMGAWYDFKTAHSDATPYVLANKSKGIGFYKYTGIVFPKGKAIWMSPNGSAETVKFNFDDVITALDALHGHQSIEGLYDLQGHRLDKVEKGQINVINGQKIMFK